MLVALGGSFVLFRHGRPLWHPVYLHIRGRRTVADVLAKYGECPSLPVRFLLSRVVVLKCLLLEYVYHKMEVLDPVGPFLLGLGDG